MDNFSVQFYNNISKHYLLSTFSQFSVQEDINLSLIFRN